MYELAISPCPNDTFAFFALLHGKTAWHERLHTRFEDIEALNLRALNKQVDVCKISFHAYLYLRNDYSLLESGSALGFGCGPLVVAKPGVRIEHMKGKTIAVPGKYTTASLLLQLWLGTNQNLVHMPFDQIMPAVVRGEVAAGLIIHESRFTFPEYGLESLIDLGSWWEQESGHAIPLGGIVARKSLGTGQIDAFDNALSQSIDYAMNHEAETIPFMRQHAQEMDTDVMRNHVSLYVNQFTRKLGKKGRAATDYLASEAERKGLC